MDTPLRTGVIRAGQHDIPSMQIGDVAERTGLSLRTIRYYEEAGLVAPSTRTNGGFRLYSESDCRRLEIVRRVKPLGFSLDEVRDLLDTLDRLDTIDPAEEPETAAVLGERLARFCSSSEDRCEELRAKLNEATAVTEMLRSLHKLYESESAASGARKR